MHHGLRQEDVAKVLGVSHGVYGDIENNKKTVSRQSWEKYFKNSKM